MDQKLADTAQAGNINALYALLRIDPYILQRIDEKPFTDTPLHIAALAGQTHFALEVIKLKSSFGRKLNPEGLSPLDLALHKGHVETARRLIKYDPQLIRVQGRENISALHYLAGSDEADLLAEFLFTCPASVKDLTIKGETAVHVAVKTGNLRAFKVLLGWLLRTGNRDVLNWGDEDGNTVLHTAVSTNQPEVVRLLIKKVKINEKNLKGMTPLDIALALPSEMNREIRKTLQSSKAKKASSLSHTTSFAEFLSSKVNLREWFISFAVYLERGLSDNMRNALLVVAVLIATATYQAVLQPPGGVSQGSNNNPPAFVNVTSINANSTHMVVRNETQTVNEAGKAVMSEGLFYPIMVSNSMSFAGSLGVIFLLLPASRSNDLLRYAVICLMLSYVLSMYVISPGSIGTPIFITLSNFFFNSITWTRDWNFTAMDASTARWLTGINNVGFREKASLAFLSRYPSKSRD